ncbi:haloalkane dehalogenase [Paraburkholderia sp. GAS32]|uniref:haloalkane dehalogenase n=1 Tax=Paraburkholderia sp. GAS32 TaxID=3035129 RepID=UPI003D1AB6B6
MKLLRTPDLRFVNMPDYGFEPVYTTIKDADGTEIRIHSVDCGPREAAPILLLHGEPSWSFLYRHMIDGLVKRGHRVVAPDLVGFGKSDKPVEQSDYTFERHVDWMSKWLDANDFREATMFAQDWGGLIGLRLLARFPDRFSRVVMGNTSLPIGTGSNEAFRRWLEFSRSTPTLKVGNIVSSGTVRGLTAEEIAAYDAPFPDETYKAGARRFPELVPITPEHPSVAENKAAWEILKTFEKPFLTTFSDRDPIMEGGEMIFRELIPGASGQPHVTISGAGHFLQEDKPNQLVEVIHSFIENTR